MSIPHPSPPALSAAISGLLSLLALGATPLHSAAQAPGAGAPARIAEEIRVLDTYFFSEPNPIPILVRDPRLYPYHSFEGYSATSEPREWRVVKLENDYIEVFVLPEVGGKVWGAVVKETGHEFIYRNEVMKFRNIALRGPWTSGGIELNFGVIGHTPSTATPVDYTLTENPDGSVSCWVGAMDLPSRTHWRVEVRLPADRAYFETNVFWYNPTPLEQPYYNWMTAAAFARDDLEMSMPGDRYLRHSGQVEAWPVDGEGRHLPLYANNTFGGHKSYHVVGELNDFFGGYYHDGGYGFGHWARHEEMPGQKLWLWALSREGGVWEDLLTDTDGQYVEFQAGRLFVQYSPGADENPITEAAFDPLSASRWTETWFPLEGTGGLTDASREGALFASEEGGLLTVGVNAFREIQDTLKVWSAGELVSSAHVALEPLEPFQAGFDVVPDQPYRVQLQGLGLDYESDPGRRRLSRSFETDPDAFPRIPAADRAAFQARELMKGRRYAQAWDLFEAALEDEPWNREALLGLAEISYRRGLYDQGLERVNRALQLDAYHARANFLAGILYQASGLPADARDAFGWASRSVAHRSAAYVRLAEIMVAEGDLVEAERYARLALDFDRFSIPAWRAVAIIGRLAGNGASAEEARSELSALDPLHHLVKAEAHLATRTHASGMALMESLGGEFPDQTLLELATGYEHLGQREDALTLLSLGDARGMGGNPVHRAWKAWLAEEPIRLAGSVDPAFAFPYRSETIPVLEWAEENSDNWVWSYLLALNLWAVDRAEEAFDLMAALGGTPDFGPFYTARGLLLRELRGADPEPDLRRAVEENPENRALHIHLIRFLEDEGRWREALSSLDQARNRFPDDFNLDLLEVQALVHTGGVLEAIEILSTTRVLPSENARDSHRLWELAHTMAALDAMDDEDYASARVYALAAMDWPESLGQGRPYAPEERLARFILARAEEGLGNEAGAREAFQSILDQSGSLDTPTDPGRRLAWPEALVPPSLLALGWDMELEEVRTLEARVRSLLRNPPSSLEARLIVRALALGREEM